MSTQDGLVGHKVPGLQCDPSELHHLVPPPPNLYTLTPLWCHHLVLPPPNLCGNHDFVPESSLASCMSGWPALSSWPMSKYRVSKKKPLGLLLVVLKVGNLVYPVDLTQIKW